MPQITGMDVLQHSRRVSPDTMVIVITAVDDSEIPIEALNAGAFYYIRKGPKLLEDLLSAVALAMDRTHLRQQNAALKRDAAQRNSLDNLIGESEPMRKLKQTIRTIATTTSTVIVSGESGTGKELVARTIHELSPRKNKPFVAINCAAIPETLIESEIFGHEKGAFTGALERRTGCFELAESGTLLLDEIGEMPVNTQAKLLRVLEDRKLRRLGSKSETTVDVRVLAATNKVPEEAVAHGQLRNDLYYRLNVFNIHMPPLRDHREDIRNLTHTLIHEMNVKHQRSVRTASEPVLQMFERFSWPGNVRELRNTLERAIIVCESSIIEPRHLPPAFGSNSVRLPVSDADGIRLGVGTTVGEAERQLIVKTLESKTLHNKLKEYGAQPQQLPGGAVAERHTGS
jgi:DNA-binding NtrC family response regulator